MANSLADVDFGIDDEEAVLFKNYEGQTQFLRADLAVTESTGRRDVTLLLDPAMKDRDAEIVVNAIQNQIAKMK